MRILIGLCLLGFLLQSCNKEEVHTGAPSLIGVWTHYSASDAWEIVKIDSDGTGKVEWYTNNKLHKETDTKTWYIKNNRLQLGKSTFNLAPYDVETYPTTSSSTTIEGFDTLNMGLRYIVMDGKNYVEKG